MTKTLCKDSRFYAGYSLAAESLIHEFNYAVRDDPTFKTLQRSYFNAGCCGQRHIFLHDNPQQSSGAIWAVTRKSPRAGRVVVEI